MGKATTLYSRKPFANGIDLHNVGAAGKELAGDVLQLFAGDQRLFEKGTSSSGEKKENCVILCKSAD